MESDHPSDDAICAKEKDGTTEGDTDDRLKLEVQVVAASERTTENNSPGSGDIIHRDASQPVSPVNIGIFDKPAEHNLSSEISVLARSVAEGGTPKGKDENLEAFSQQGEASGTCTGEERGENRGTKEEDLSNRPYYVKWIKWKGIKTPIVTQNDNGPCPLLAIINILLLRRAIEFPAMQEMVTTSQLMEYLGDHVLKEVPENLDEGVKRNFEQNMQDAFSILPKLKTGLDVNVKFTGVGDFEFTPECVVFDLLNIKLNHGWLFDPQSIAYQTAIGGLSYNQLVEKIVASKEPNAEGNLASEGLAAECFLEETANQLTCHGLCELNAKLHEDELCVFFRNNHFSTLYKHQNELFVLLTDLGFLTEDHIIWQTLSNVDGDGIFVDGNFKTLPMKDLPKPPAFTPSALSQEDQDFMLALSLQNEQQQQQQQQQSTSQQTTSEQTSQQTTSQQTSQQTTSQQTTSQQTTSQQQAQSEAPDQPTQQWPPDKTSDLNPTKNKEMSQQELFDLQYAIQLQEEENQMGNQAQARRQERSPARRHNPTPAHQPPVQPQRESQKSCIIL